MIASEILNKLNLTESIFKQYPVQIAYFHGSAAQNRNTKLSDIDIAIVVDYQVDSKQYLNIELELSVALENKTGLKDLDVRIINLAPLEVKGKVLEEGLLVFSADEEKRVAFETYTRDRYFDFKPIANYMHHQFFKRISQEGLID